MTLKSLNTSTGSIQRWVTALAGVMPIGSVHNYLAGSIIANRG